MGGLMYSTAFSTDGTTIEQVHDWNMFVSLSVLPCRIFIVLSGSLVVTSPHSRFATLLDRTPAVIARTPSIVLVWHTTCPTMLRMVSLKYATRIPWISLAFIPPADKHFHIPSPPSP